jgi:hypothetical protein
VTIVPAEPAPEATSPREGTQQVAAATYSALEQLSSLPAADSAPEQQRQNRKVVVNAVQCRTQ